jgi:hypothetical protein
MVSSRYVMESRADLYGRSERRRVPDRVPRRLRSTRPLSTKDALFAFLVGLGVGVCAAVAVPIARVALPQATSGAAARYQREPPAELVLTPSSTQAGVLEGIVRDRHTHALLPSATVRVEHTSLATVTDGGGRFRLADTPAGTYVLRVEAAGYLVLSRPGVLVLPGRHSAITIELDRASGRLGDEVIVRAPTFDRSPEV